MAINFPSSPTNGQTYLGYYWDGTKGAWRSLQTNSSAVVTSPTAPVSATAGDLWFNSTDGTLYVYYNDGITSQWVEIQANVDNYKAPSPNYIINGAFDIWQRGTSFSFSGPSGFYTTDRWAFFTDGTGAAVTVSQQALPAGAIPQAESGKFFTRINRTAAGTGGTYSNFQQPIEDVRTISGQTVTISLWAKADAARTISVNLNQDFGTGGSTSVVATAQNATITTSWARYSFTFVLPSVAGKTISATDSKLWIYVSTPNVVSTIDIWGVQLESGAVATPFRRNANSIQGELAACQRYYQRYTTDGNSTYQTIGVGQAQSSTQAWFMINLIVPMRKLNPDLSYSNVGDWGAHRPGQTITQATSMSSTAGLGSSNMASIYMGFGADGSYGANVPCMLSSRGISGAWLAFSAEL